MQRTTNDNKQKVLKNKLREKKEMVIDDVDCKREKQEETRSYPTKSFFSC